MIKQDLIQRVVERTGLTRTKAEAAVDAIFESMKASLVSGDRVKMIVKAPVAIIKTPKGVHFVAGGGSWSHAGGV